MQQKGYILQWEKMLLIALLILPTSIVVSQSTVTRLGIVNPTPANLHNLMNLVSKKYVTADDSLVFVGIYHESQNSSITATERFIEKNNYNHITIEIIEGELLIDNLFEKNCCSRQFEEVFENTDALIFFGGYDVPPRTYNEETFLTTEHFDKGKNWELSFMHHLIGGSQSDIDPLLIGKPNYIILGICLGMQEMNVAGGGSLYQDIPFQLYQQTTYEGVLRLDAANIHKNYHNNIDNENRYTATHFHPIAITPKSFLDFDGIDTNPLVESIHHQAAKDVAQDFEVVATSIDGKVIEAIQHTRFRNVYGIQFHTEFSTLYDEKHEFVISPQETITLTDDTRVFFEQFWYDFSKRLK